MKDYSYYFYDGSYQQDYSSSDILDSSEVDFEGLKNDPDLRSYLECFCCHQISPNCRSCMECSTLICDDCFHNQILATHKCPYCNTYERTEAFDSIIIKDEKISTIIRLLYFSNNQTPPK